MTAVLLVHRLSTEVYVHLLSDVWPVQLCVDLAPSTPCTTSYLEDSSFYRLAEILIVETLKLRLTSFGLVVTPSLVYPDDWIYDFISEDFPPYLTLEQLPNEHRKEIR